MLCTYVPSLIEALFWRFLGKLNTSFLLVYCVQQKQKKGAHNSFTGQQAQKSQVFKVQNVQFKTNFFDTLSLDDS